MIDPYLAVALQTKVKHVKTRDEVQINLEHIGNMIEMVTHMSVSYTHLTLPTILRV